MKIISLIFFFTLFHFTFKNISAVNVAVKTNHIA